ncbi:NF-kappa-B inhibitor cactus [Manduca sexta]|uniref:Cactus n=1 Tax=Manduca sexta TaxID=7130 RepID=A0A921YTZ5_MANSE|nr:NF-kappa-B inhibitor cactus [Manduca sexta]KAG6445480.1 hypothetical protein O3G_MSEX003931 [Manduca sexta]KAG6445481.1 hypothetical protein O3G_MSEX003931 [Manduca sexta]
MSAKKGYETKIVEEENMDSGIVSGELESYEISGEVDSGVIDCDKKYEGVPSEVLELTDKFKSVNVREKSCPDVPPLADLFHPDNDGDTQLHIASVHGCEKSVSTIIRVCPDKEWLDLPNDYGHTPLHLAVMSGNAVVTRMLVIAGASLAIRDFMGETPLHKATAARNQECLKALLAPVPEQPNRKLSSILDQRNYNGQCCVHLAASIGSVETLQTLVYYGADINARENLAGWTALHIAARRGDVRVVQFLRSRCAGAATRPRDYAGRTPRRLARRTKAAAAFDDKDDSDSDSDSDDDDMYDSDSETLFEKLRESLSTSINVA